MNGRHRSDLFRRAISPLIVATERGVIALQKRRHGLGCVNVDRAAEYKLVLAHRRGIVLGAFRPTKWLEATPENFPWLDEPISGRYGFEGKPAEESVRNYYTQSNRRVPDRLRRKGAAMLEGSHSHKGIVTWRVHPVASSLLTI
jgi:hypothetical protein